MRRLFTSFPAGPPGVGLLLLRGTLGTLGVVKAGLLLKHDERMTLDFAAIACAGAAGFLVLGFLTPIAAVCLGLSTVAFWVAAGPISLGPEAAMRLFVIGDAAAIALLGPGAYSFDARLFGRREIVIRLDPPSRSP